MATECRRKFPAAGILKGLNRQKQVQAMKKALRKKAKDQQRGQQLSQTKASLLTGEYKGGE